MHTRRHTVTHLPTDMRSSNSAELKENPSNKLERKKAWEALLSKGRSQSKLESNMKTLDTGYIASIFSTNYTTGLRRAPHHTKPFDRDDLLLPRTRPCTEGFAQKKFVIRSVRSRQRALSMVSDITLDQPPSSLNKEEDSTGQEAILGGIEGGEYLESMKSWKLMKDLDEHADHFSKVEPPLGYSNEDFGCIEAAFSTESLDQSSQATAPHTVSVLRRARSLPRAKYLTSFDSTENADASIVTNNEAEELVEPRLMHHDSGAPESDGVNTYTHVCDPANVEPFPLCERAIHVEGHPPVQITSVKPRNLQKALSMKYILNEFIIENVEPQTLPVSHASPQLSMLHVGVQNDDDDDDEDDQASISRDSSCMSSPEFSSVASLKDWLPSKDSPLMPAASALEAGNQISVLDTFEASHVLLGPDLPSSTKGVLQRPDLHSSYTNSVLLKYVGGNYSPSHDLNQSTFQSMAPAPGEDGVAASLTKTSDRDSEQLLKEGPCASKSSNESLQELYNLAELWIDLTL